MNIVQFILYLLGCATAGLMLALLLTKMFTCPEHFTLNSGGVAFLRLDSDI